MEVFFVHDIFEKIKIEKIKYGKKRTYNESKGEFDQIKEALKLLLK